MYKAIEIIIINSIDYRLVQFHLLNFIQMRKLILCTISLSLLLIITYVIYFIRYNDVLQQLTSPGTKMRIRLQQQDDGQVHLPMKKRRRYKQNLLANERYITYQPPGNSNIYIYLLPHSPLFSPFSINNYRLCLH